MSAGTTGKRTATLDEATAVFRCYLKKKLRPDEPSGRRDRRLISGTTGVDPHNFSICDARYRNIAG